MDELSTNEFVVVDQFIRPDIYTDIKCSIENHLPAFKKAGIGTLNTHTVKEDIRGDLTYWLEREREQELKPFWCLLDETQFIFKRYCYLSLDGFEFHFAKYPPGAQYAKHLDQFSNRSNRMISMIIYLNDKWQKGDGGELEIFLKNGETTIVEPLAGRCVLFKSAEVPHRVMESFKDRYSLTGWLLDKPADVGVVLG
jgi:SM-20-related protein